MSGMDMTRLPCYHIGMCGCAIEHGVHPTHGKW